MIKNKNFIKFILQNYIFLIIILYIKLLIEIFRCQMVKRLLIFFLILFIFSCNELISQEENLEEQEKEHKISNYHFSIFNGFTSNFEHKTDDYTLGIDYEQRLLFLDRMFGIGLIIEGVFAEHKENILAIPITAHLGFADLKLFLAPGVIFGEKTVETFSSHLNKLKKEAILKEEIITKTESYRNFLFRLGVGYDFHYNIFGITPTLAFDFYNGVMSIIWGVSLGLSL